MAAPLLLGADPISAIAITGAAVTLTSAAGVVTTVPTAAILAGKALVLKGLALGALAGGALAGGQEDQRSNSYHH